MFSYQDLSEARYSGHVEHYESVTETRSFSKVAPPPPERSFSQSRGQQYGHHDLHTRERALASAEREGSTSRELSMEKESRSGHHPDCDKCQQSPSICRWEYRGQGIWENRDSDYEGRWSEEREVAQQPGPGRLSLDRELTRGHQEAGVTSASANSSFTRKISANTAPGGASTATAGL